MADNVELDDEQLLRKLLETIARGKGDPSSSSEGIQENVAQLLAAALNQVSQETGSGDILASNEVEINNVDNTVEVPSSSSSSAPTGGTATTERQKNLGIKFSPEIRRTIVNYRKGGKRYCTFTHLWFLIDTCTCSKRNICIFLDRVKILS